MRLHSYFMKHLAVHLPAHCKIGALIIKATAVKINGRGPFWQCYEILSHHAEEGLFFCCHWCACNQEAGSALPSAAEASVQIRAAVVTNGMVTADWPSTAHFVPVSERRGTKWSHSAGWEGLCGRFVLTCGPSAHHQLHSLLPAINQPNHTPQTSQPSAFSHSGRPQWGFSPPFLSVKVLTQSCSHIAYDSKFWLGVGWELLGWGELLWKLTPYFFPRLYDMLGFWSHSSWTQDYLRCSAFMHTTKAASFWPSWLQAKGLGKIKRPREAVKNNKIKNRWHTGWFPQVLLWDNFVIWGWRLSCRATSS